MLTTPADRTVTLRRKAVGASLAARLQTLGIEVSWSADDLCLLLRDVAGARGRIAVDAQGWIAAYETPMQRLWRFRCNTQGEPVSLTAPSGFTLQVGFIHAPQDASQSPGVEPWTLRDLPAWTRNNAGQAVHLVYDGRADLYGLRFHDGTSRFIETAGSARSLLRAQPSMAPLDQVWRVLNRDGSQAAFEWDPHGRLTALKIGNGQGFAYTYGADGSIETHRGSTMVERVCVDGRGAITAVERGGATVTVETAAAGRPKSLCYGAGNDTTFDYDDAGRIAGATLHEDGVTTHTAFQWSDSGRLVCDATALQEHRWTLDPGGLPCELHDGPGPTLRIAYDADERPLEIVDWLGGRHRIEYQPGDRGEIRTTAAGVRITLAREPSGQLSSLNVTHEGRSLFSEACRYPPEGRAIALADSVSGEIAVQPAAVAPERNAQGYPIRCSGQELSCDAAGRIVARRPPDGALWRYVWNVRGQLAAVSSPGGAEVRFTYDALGRVLERHTGATATRFLWAGDTLAGDEATHLATGAVQRRRFVHHPLTGEPLLMRLERFRAAGQPAAQDEVFAIHTGCLGLPRAMTGSRGELVWLAAIAPTGQLDVRFARVDLPLRAADRYADEAFALLLTRGHPIVPALGMALAPHPLGLLSGLDPYAGGGGEESWLSFITAAVAAEAGVLAGTAALATGCCLESGRAPRFSGATLATWIANGLQRPSGTPSADAPLPPGRRYRLWPEPCAAADPVASRLQTGIHGALRRSIRPLAGPLAVPEPPSAALLTRQQEALRARPPQPLPVRPATP